MHFIFSKWGMKCEHLYYRLCTFVYADYHKSLNHKALVNTGVYDKQSCKL